MAFENASASDLEEDLPLPTRGVSQPSHAVVQAHGGGSAAPSPCYRRHETSVRIFAELHVWSLGLVIYWLEFAKVSSDRRFLILTQCWMARKDRASNGVDCKGKWGALLPHGKRKRGRTGWPVLLNKKTPKGFNDGVPQRAS